ncbi:MAG TPA: hypothetical protein VG318_09185 [Actinomycetota bacterium]|nr:hypothetical protein [Actinomycetota bacterium]
MAGHVKAFFDRPPEQQRLALVSVLREMDRYPVDVLRAIANTPRHLLLPPERSRLSYWNGPNICLGTIAIPAPWLIAYSLTRLRVRAGANVLILGFGRGYMTLCASILVGAEGSVTAIEIDSSCVIRGRRLLGDLDVSNVRILHGDALNVDRRLGLYDSIWCSLASEELLPEWIELTKKGGRLGAFLPDRTASQMTGDACAENDLLLAGHWWTKVSLNVFRREADLVWETRMPNLVNAPLLRRDDRLPFSVDCLYPGLLEDEVFISEFLDAT